MRSTKYEVHPFAKINLNLTVGLVRPDGFHVVQTLLQSIALSDTLTVTMRSGPFALEVDRPDIPTDERNLVWRAAARLWSAAGREGPPRDAQVQLQKRIPAAAGLGGGSSDAAAALAALNVGWGIDFADERLAELAGELGSDIPFFLSGGTARAEGRGEQLTALPDIDPFDVVLISPGFGVSTPDAYRWLGEDRLRGGASLLAGVGVQLGAETGEVTIENDLQRPVSARHPEIVEAIRALLSVWPVAAAMSGSGSAVFGLFSPDSWAKAAKAVARPGWTVHQTRTLSRSQAKSQIRLW